MHIPHVMYFNDDVEEENMSGDEGRANGDRGGCDDIRLPPPPRLSFRGDAGGDCGGVDLVRSIVDFVRSPVDFVRSTVAFVRL